MINSNLPTDNLYKFMAIAGVVLFIFGAYTSFTSLRETQTAIWQFGSEARTIEREQEWVAREIARINAENPVNADVEGRAEAAAELQKAEDRLAKYMKLDAILKQQNDRLHQSAEGILRLENENKWSALVRSGGVFCAIIGLVLATVGFLLWYKRVQVYQDIALRNAALETSDP